MRIIIKESQLKLIVEQREGSVKDDLINRAKEYTSIVDLFNNDRELYHTLKKRYILYDIFPHSVRTQILIDKAKKYKTISTLRLREPELFKKLRDKGLIDELFPIKKTFIPNIPSDEENYPPNTNLQENIQRIKEVMGIDNEPFNNWVMPSMEDLQREYKIEHEMKHLGAFNDFESFLSAVKDGEVMSVPPEKDAKINYRSRTKNQEQLLSLIKSYRSYPEFRNEDTLQAIYDGFKNNSEMILPIVLEYPDGRLRVFSGNTRMDIANHLNIIPKVLLIVVP